MELIEGQRRLANKSAYFRTNLSEDGTMKLCTGPGHDEPTWLPATEKYFYLFMREGKKPKLSSRCRLCNNWPKLKSPGLSGWLPAEMALPFYTEAVHRVGLMELARRAGVDDRVITNVLHNRQRYVQKRTFKAVLLQLISMRRKGEVRHRDSIHYGATVRQPSKMKSHIRRHPSGKVLEIQEQVRAVGTEKPVRSRNDLYKPNGDDEAEYRRRLRRERSV